MASIMALCSAWMQQVLSVTFSSNESLSIVQILWPPKFLGGELNPLPMIRPSLTTTEPHSLLKQVDLIASS